MTPPRQTLRSRLFVIPLRALWHRFAFLILAMLASGLLVIGQIQPQLVAPVRVHIVDGFAPVLDAMTRPADMMRSAGEIWDNWMNTQEEVIRLRAENARLKIWEQSGGTLAAENGALKSLLNFHNEPAQTSLTARVIATSGGPYAGGMIVTAGARDGVHVGMAAVTADGLIGRIIEVGDWSARILLLTDINSRVPVMLQKTGERGILTGEDRPELQLLYLPPDADVRSGSRVVTSGHGGVFPPHIPVGIIVADSHGAVQVAPIADLGRVDYVRLIDFSLAGGEANSFTRELQNPRH